MKTILRFAIVPLVILAFSCKKSTIHPNCCVVNTQPILFEIVDKNGNSVIHSVNDNLSVSYVNSSGLPVTQQLDIFRVQKSATDTTRSSDYNGFIISDGDTRTPGKVGYMSTTSGDGTITSFKLYLNNQLLGPVFFDYWAALKMLTAASNPNFTLNGMAATQGIANGILAPGYPSSIGYPTNQYFFKVADIPVFVLHLQ